MPQHLMPRLIPFRFRCCASVTAGTPPIRRCRSAALWCRCWPWVRGTLCAVVCIVPAQPLFSSCCLLSVQDLASLLAATLRLACRCLQPQ